MLLTQYVCYASQMTMEILKDKKKIQLEGEMFQELCVVMSKRCAIGFVIW